jgi:hypothetical protein
MTDWLGYTLYVRGPWWIMRRDNAFVDWCLRHAGAWAYRDHDFGHGDASSRLPSEQ